MCCRGCESGLLADPAKYLAKLNGENGLKADKPNEAEVQEKR
jgi:hypothetical protein